MVMSTPALRAIRKKFADSFIVSLTVPRSAEVIKRLPYFDAHVCFNQEGFRKKYSLSQLKSLMNTLRLLRSLRRQEFDMIIDLTAIESWKAAVLRSIFFKIIGAHTLAGRDTDSRGVFLDVKAPEELRGTMHDVERKLRIAGALGADIEDTDIEFRVFQKDRIFIDRWLEEKGIVKDDALVALNPGSFLPTRRWRSEGFVEIGKRLYKEYGVQVVVVGGDKERRLVSDMAERLEDVRPLKVLDLDIGQLGALLERLKLLVTNDTGSMHIASALGVPVVAIFGPENHYRFRPYGKGLSSVIVPTVSLSCHPCVKDDCKIHECMESITPDLVWKEVDALINELIGRKLWN